MEVVAVVFAVICVIDVTFWRSGWLGLYVYCD